jgi:uncharacterized protein with HEPN domain
MPSDPAAILADIEHHIELALEFASGIEEEDFIEDMRTVYAVTRCLEIVSEASRRLPEDMKARHPSTPWREIAAAGNVYRHDYEDVAARVVLDTVRIALPQLRLVILAEIDRLDSPEG